MSQTSTEERLQRALHENVSLKRERVELQDKLKRVKTQFRSLVEEWSLLQRTRRSSASHSNAVATDGTNQVANRSSEKENRAANNSPHGTAHASYAQHGSKDTQNACARLQRVLDEREVELQQARSQLQRMEQALQDRLHEMNNMSHATRAAPADLSTPDAASRVLESEYKLTIDALIGERDALARRVSELNAQPQTSGALRNTTATLMELQTALRERSVAVATLHHRAQLAQEQVSLLQTENARLISELKAAHEAHAELQRKLFQAEISSGLEETLRRDVAELEQSLEEKNTLLAQMEQELLRTVHTMQSESRESALAVRQEYSARLAELQAMRDAAHDQRRRSELALRERQQLCEELQHTVSLLQSELAAEKERVVGVERALAESRAQKHAAERLSGMSCGLSRAEVEQAMAVARMMRRRRRMQSEVAASGSRPGGGAAVRREMRRDEDAFDAVDRDKASSSPVTGKDAMESNDKQEEEDGDGENSRWDRGGETGVHSPRGRGGDAAVDLYTELVWDESWESAQLREALAHATLEQELADARATQATAALQCSRTLQKRVAAERDTLLAECAELRQRIGHVETVFAAQQRCAYEAARAGAGAMRRRRGEAVCRTTGAQIDLCVCGIYAPCAPPSRSIRQGSHDANSGSTATDRRRCSDAAEDGVSRCAEATGEAAARLYRALGVSGPDSDSLSLFFTLDDGWAMYETMISPVFHHLGDVGEVHFTYRDLDPDEITLARLCRSSFVLQLHRVLGGGSGSESVLVGMGELPGTALLAGRGCITEALEEWVTLIDGSGEHVARVRLRVSSVGLLLPVMLTRPLRVGSATCAQRASNGEEVAAAGNGWSYSAEEVTAAVMALRTVRALRVRVFDARNLSPSLLNAAKDNEDARAHDLGAEEAHAAGKSGERSSSEPHRQGIVTELLPQPYVFYTAHHPAFTQQNAVDARSCEALSCVRDTVVYPANPSFTVNPVFDACPVDHRVGLVDAALVRFLETGSIVFVVFDARARDARVNLGTVELPLRPMLASPTAVLHETRALHPQGSLTVGISWVTGP